MNDVSAVAHEGFTLLGATGGPLVLGLLVVGVVMGIFQATTQINDPAVSFLPRLLVAILGSYLMGGWVMERCAKYLASAIERIAGGA
ncbi:MAG: flagellar biosynthetic protein FliQ [Deltaproteobacteria bacterium]|nr:flagellar biosynthetic protein FliQ [Deltaproteobacteria bacterium]